MNTLIQIASRNSRAALVAMLLAGLASSAWSQNGPQARTLAAAEDTSVTGPDWLILEEDSYPLRLESATALDNARRHFRRGEEVAAGNEIRKAVSWIKLAETHAQSTTKHNLKSAELELTRVASDLITGNLADAARMESALARASHALAEYHFYKAKESFGRTQTVRAAQDLEAAVTHLENAARSAHFQYGPDTLTVFDDVLEDGELVSKTRTVDNNRLGKNLDGVELAIDAMADSLK